jgi:hypothetical protein
VTGTEWQKEKKFDSNTYGPVKIKTDAWRMVKVWTLDEYGDYMDPTEKEVKDTGYWLHFSVSKTTLGCIRMDSAWDASDLASKIDKALGNGEEVTLEVAR